MQYKILMSYTPFDPVGLKNILDMYEHQSQMQIVSDFERQIREFTGAKYAVALSSGTAAIHLALRAAGVGPGDEVLVSTFTYVATVNPIIYLGAKPVFIDSEPVTWNMDPILLEEAVTDRIRSGRKPKAILVNHTYGMPAGMKGIMAISEQFGIPVIEDAAAAFGSTTGDKKVGTIAQSGIYSFNHNKLFTTYGGGALVTNDEDLYHKVLFWASQSRENKPYYEHKEIGYNYRMGLLSAAQGLVGMKTVVEKIGQHRLLFENYRSILGSIAGVSLPVERAGSYSNRWLTTVLVPESKLRHIQDILFSEGIESRPLWNPMHRQPVFSGYQCFANGVAESLFTRGLCLPSGCNVTAGEAGKVAAIIRRQFAD